MSREHEIAIARHKQRYEKAYYGTYRSNDYTDMGWRSQDFDRKSPSPDKENMSDMIQGTKIPLEMFQKITPVLYTEWESKGQAKAQNKSPKHKWIKKKAKALRKSKNFKQAK